MPTRPHCSPSTPKHHVQPRQHLGTFSPPARRLNSGQTHLALIAQSCLVSDLESHLAFLPFASPFGTFGLSRYPTQIFRADSALSPPAAAGNCTHRTWRGFFPSLPSCRCYRGGIALLLRVHASLWFFLQGSSDLEQEELCLTGCRGDFLEVRCEGRELLERARCREGHRAFLGGWGGGLFYKLSKKMEVA